MKYLRRIVCQKCGMLDAIEDGVLWDWFGERLREPRFRCCKCGWVDDVSGRIGQHVRSMEPGPDEDPVTFSYRAMREAIRKETLP